MATTTGIGNSDENDNDSLGRKRLRQQLRYVEFYSGVGGWTMALQDALGSCSQINRDDALCCVAALDHSDLCNKVYQHNHHGGKHIRMVRIETLTVSQLIEWRADMWMMSPPCQPHTRQHSHQAADAQDARSNSFLHLCKLLRQLPPESRPKLILLENVVGFEQSSCCREWIRALLSSGYIMAHFHLQPFQVGLPNDRPRYYCVAVQYSVSGTLTGTWMERYFAASKNETPSDQHVGHVVETTILIHQSLDELGIVPAEKIVPNSLPSLRTICDASPDNNSLRIPDLLLQKSAAWCLDIVSAESRRTSCFTSAYGKYMKGTGSVMLQPDDVSTVNVNDKGAAPVFTLLPPEDRQFDPDWAGALVESSYHLRYFSGTELARLFGFSASFGFPPDLTVRQQWKLIGNSLNVRVASKLIELGLSAVYGLDNNKQRTK